MKYKFEPRQEQTMIAYTTSVNIEALERDKHTDKPKVVIRPQKSLLDINLKDIWQYRDLLAMFVKRDVVTVYKQTILGPLWYLVQPILTTLTYILIFGEIADISSDGVPRILFYLSGIVIWNYFSETFTRTSKTFKENERVFGKVYFPRLIVPLSVVISGLIRFFIQFALFIAIYLFIILSGNESVQPHWQMILLPVYILLMAGFSVGAGTLFSSLTSKYRDLSFLLQFGIQLLMYATPIIYPVSTIPEKYRPFILANPFTPIVEGMKYSFLGAGFFSWPLLAYSFACMLFVLFVGIVVFNKTERTFMDTV